MWQTVFWAVVLSLSAFFAAIAVSLGKEPEFSPYVDAAGAITLPEPETVRARWSHLGTYAVAGADGVAEFHLVYAAPGTIEAWRETGAFADGAVLVKEVRKAAQGALTTGEVSWSAEVVLWFVMVKDREGRFPGNPLWAEGWGWALFLAEDRATNAATDFRADCMTCHVPAQATDWVYTQGYPVLRD